MHANAFQTRPEPRLAARHSVDHPVIAEHAHRGDLRLRIANISPHGFMVHGDFPIGRGERVMLRLPVIGRIEAQVMWVDRQRAGLRFERLIRLGDFDRLLSQLKSTDLPHVLN